MVCWFERDIFWVALYCKWYHFQRIGSVNDLRCREKDLEKAQVALLTRSMCPESLKLVTTSFYTCWCDNWKVSCRSEASGEWILTASWWWGFRVILGGRCERAAFSERSVRALKFIDLGNIKLYGFRQRIDVQPAFDWGEGSLMLKLWRLDSRRLFRSQPLAR